MRLGVSRDGAERERGRGSKRIQRVARGSQREPKRATPLEDVRRRNLLALTLSFQQDGLRWSIPQQEEQGIIQLMQNSSANKKAQRMKLSLECECVDN